MQEEAVMCKREHTHKSVVKSNTVGMVVTCDLAIFPSASATAKTRDLKIIFRNKNVCGGGGGKGHVRMGCGGRFCFRRLQVLKALDLSKELI